MSNEGMTPVVTERKQSICGLRSGRENLLDALSDRLVQKFFNRQDLNLFIYYGYFYSSQLYSYYINPVLAPRPVQEYPDALQTTALELTRRSATGNCE